jgi:tRNA-2-methylthio-N6-dimethylallyladenosine synthase
MNERDSQGILNNLLSCGFVVSDTIYDADVVIFNTCSVRELSQNRAIECARQIVMEKPSAIVGLAGCSVQILKDEVFKKIPGLSFACGPDDVGLIANIVQRTINGERNILEVKRNHQDNISGLFNGQVRAMVNISRGCENFCSYCIVPYARGKLINRPVDDIVKEIVGLVNNGVQEVTLLGQNVSAYRWNNYDFPELLKVLQDKTDIKRIRFLTSHPKDIDERLLKTLASLSKICEHIHLPFQSGSDRILCLMNRGYTRQHYIDVIKKCRDIIPGCSITTDVIVGFPQESENDFNDTTSLLQEIRFDGAYVFKYSPRKGTAAYNIADDVPSEGKRKRHRIALNIATDIASKNLKKLIETKHEVLVEGIAKKSTGFKIYVKGHTRTNRSIVFPVDSFFPGQILNVIVKNVVNQTLIGAICQ